MDAYHFNQPNERASTIQDNAGLVSEPQLELTAILRVRIGCHRWCYVFSRQLHVFACNQRINVLVTVKIALGFASYNYLTVTRTIIYIL